MEKSVKVNFRVQPTSKDKFTKATMVKLFTELKKLKASGRIDGRYDVVVTDIDGYRTLWTVYPKGNKGYYGWEWGPCMDTCLTEGEGNLPDREVYSCLKVISREKPQYWEVEHSTI